MWDFRHAINQVQIGRPRHNRAKDLFRSYSNHETKIPKSKPLVLRDISFTFDLRIVIWNLKVTLKRHENTNAISWWLEHHCGRGTDIYKCSFKVANYLWLVTLEIVTNGIQVLKLHSFINLGTINKIRRQFFRNFVLLSFLYIFKLLTPPHSRLPTYFMDGPHWGRLNHTNVPFANLSNSKSAVGK